MKIKYLLAWLLCLFVFVGCSTTNSAGKLLSSTAITVDGAMQGWAQWCAAGQSNDSQEAKVKDAYQKYQASMQIALNAYDAFSKTGEQSAWDTAKTVLSANKDTLVALISSFTTTNAVSTSK